jgi:drug/metabolite transporter (DMT)-like permease
MVGFTCYNIVFKKLRPALASSFAYVNPVVALILGTVIGGETVSLYAIMGVGVVVVGVLFIRLAQTVRQ